MSKKLFWIEESALQTVQDRLAALDKYLAEQDNGSGEPECGYADFDETVSDYARDIAEDTEHLMSTIKPVDIDKLGDAIGRRVGEMMKGF